MARKNIKRPRLNSRKKRRIRYWQEQQSLEEAQEMADRILRNPCTEIEGPVGMQASIVGQEE
jgi:hypothetical protein